MTVAEEVLEEAAAQESEENEESEEEGMRSEGCQDVLYKTCQEEMLEDENESEIKNASEVETEEESEVEKLSETEKNEENSYVDTIRESDRKEKLVQEEAEGLEKKEVMMNEEEKVEVAQSEVEKVEAARSEEEREEREGGVRVGCTMCPTGPPGKAVYYSTRQVLVMAMAMVMVMVMVMVMDLYLLIPGRSPRPVAVVSAAPDIYSEGAGGRCKCRCI